MTKAINEREIVLAILMEVTEQGAYSHLLLRDVLSKYQFLEKKERAFITRLTEGTLERRIELDYILDQFSKVKVKKMKPVIRNILRCGVYQLMYMDLVPDHAVCSESVKLAGKKGFSGLKGFVNGVLRNVARGWREVEYPEDPLESLSVRCSCPLWIVQMWNDSYGMEVTERMAADFQKEKPLTIRCCRDRISPEELKARLEKEGAVAEPHPYLADAFFLSGFDYLESLPSFSEGLFAVQDVSSMLAGALSDPKPGDFVLDLCAAPGGKSIHVAQQLLCLEREQEKQEGASFQKGLVEARDLTEYKRAFIEENRRRFGLCNVKSVCMDATILDESAREKADLVLADLPCSGLGVLGRKPDLKYRISPEDLDQLSELQRTILSNAQAYVKKGGVLLYSTCTVSPKENRENVRWFLEKYPEFVLDDLTDRLCPQLKDGVEEGCLQLLPGVHLCDGFFIARMVRRGMEE